MIKLKTLIFAALAATPTFTSAADYDIVLPVITKHYAAGEDIDHLNEDNRGIGINISTESFSSGISYISENSFNKEAYYLYSEYTRRLTANVKIGVGGFAATGYSENGLRASPMISVRWKMIRAVTTYPAGAISEKHADILNVQILIPLN